MKRHTKNKVKRIRLTFTQVSALRWKDGKAEEAVKGGRWKARPDLDFGTSMGDILIDPWIQEIVRLEPQL